MGASIVAGVDAPPVLDAPEGVLDLVALSIERLVVVDLDRSVGSGRDAGRDAACDQRSAEPVGVIAPVAQQGFGFGKSVDHQGRALVVAHLALTEQQDQGTTLAVADHVQLGVQAAFGAADTSGNSRWRF